MEHKALLSSPAEVWAAPGVRSQEKIHETSMRPFLSEYRGSIPEPRGKMEQPAQPGQGGSVGVKKMKSSYLCLKSLFLSNNAGK